MWGFVSVILNVASMRTWSPFIKVWRRSSPSSPTQARTAAEICPDLRDPLAQSGHLAVHALFFHESCRAGLDDVKDVANRHRLIREGPAPGFPDRRKVHLGCDPRLRRDRPEDPAVRDD